MIKKLLIVFSLLSLGLSAQHYTPFPEDTAVWEVKYYNVPGGPYTIYDFYRYTMMGDTVINAVSYNKIYQQHYKETVMQTPVYNYDPVVYFAGLRQDSVNKKVYALMHGTTMDTLLYDFNNNGLNDSVRRCFVSTSGNNYTPGYNVNVCQPLIVWQIDSVLAPWNKYYKALNFDVCSLNWNGWSCNHLYNSAHPFLQNSGSLIEGIGSCWGLFEKLESTFEFAGWSLNYFCDNKYGQCDARPLGIVKNEMQNDVHISPNPFSDLLTVSINDFSKTSFSIYTSLGNCVYSKTISETKTRVELNELPSGIYYAEVISPQGRLVKKIIKN